MPRKTVRENSGGRTPGLETGSHGLDVDAASSAGNHRDALRRTCRSNSSRVFHIVVRSFARSDNRQATQLKEVAISGSEKQGRRGVAQVALVAKRIIGIASAHYP